MRFTIAKLLIAMLLLNVLVCLSFAAPAWIGYPILTLISLIVVPPIIIVGVVNTRGPRQAFFLGCMVAGMPHFLVSLYMAVIMVISYQDWDWLDEDGVWVMQMSHVAGYFLGMLGGLSGLGAYFMIVGNDRKKKSVEPEQMPSEDFDKPEAPFTSEESIEASRPLARTPK